MNRILWAAWQFAWNMSLFGFVLGSEAAEKPSWLPTGEKIARDSPTWRRTKYYQAVSKAEPGFCSRDEKWVTYLNLHKFCCMFNDACFLAVLEVS